MKWSKSKAELLQFIKFGLVGVSNTAISLAIYYLFIFFNKDYYQLGNIVGWVVSVGNSFFWNYRLVFKDRARDLRELLKKVGKTYVSYGGTFLLSTCLLFLEVEVIGWPEAICPLINLFVTIPLNYFLNKFWVYKQTKHK